jgi:hypothetical protein
MAIFKNEQLPLKPEFNFWEFFFVEILNQIWLARTMGDTAMKIGESNDKSILRRIDGAS